LTVYSANSSRRILMAALLATTSAASFTARAQESTVLERLEVEAESDDILVQDGYVAKSGRIGTKTDTPLVEVPQAISAVTERQLDEQNPRTLNESLGYVPGVSVDNYGFDPRFEAFFIRGFPATYNGIFRDGLRQFSSPTGFFRTEPYGLEGITILKGPASALYGPSSAGGLVELMTKRPTEDLFREVEVQYGSNERYQGNFDFSGPVNADKTFLARLTGVVRDSGTEIEGFSDDRVYIAPAFTWQPTDDTRLTVLGEYMNSTVGGTAFFYNDGNRVTDIYEGDPSYNDFNQEQGRIGYEFQHRFNETFTFRQNVRYAALDNDLEYAYVSGFDGDTPLRSAGRNAENVETFVADNQLLADFSTGPVDHLSIVGVDYGWVTYDQKQGYGDIPADGGTLPLSFTSAQDMSQVGVYAQDQVSYENWRLTLGGRYDWLTADTTVADGSTTTEDYDRFSGRVGLSYVTEFGIVPYINYTTSFTPNVGVTIDGTPARPTIGEQKEIGIKYEVPNYNAVITAALFDIEQADGVIFEVVDGFNKQVSLDMRSRGLELELATSLDNGINLIAGYAYTDIEFVDGYGGLDLNGNKLSGIPQHTFSIWGDYTIGGGPAAGLGFGAGVRYVGTSPGDDENTFDNDDRIFLDAAVHYDFGATNAKLEGLRLQVNARNLLDEQGTVCTSGACYRDEGRSVIGSLRYRF
jgi:iron complex outermembrane recepter protein